MKYQLLMIPVLCTTMVAGVFAAEVEETKESANTARPAQAQRQRQGQQLNVDNLVERHFTFAKADKEKLTLEEYKAARAAELARMKERLGDRYNAEQAEKRIADAFKRYDKDSKGYITKEELKAGIEADRKATQERTPNNNRQRPQRAQRPQQAADTNTEQSVEM